MKEITYIGEIGGGNHPMIVTLPINADTDIKKGTPIFYNNHAASTSDSADGTLIGILAEDYYCEENELIPGSGSGEIKVIVSNNAVYECDALVFSGGGDTGGALVWTFTAMPDEEFAASMCGSKMILHSKDATSINKDSVGMVYNVTSCDPVEGPYIFFNCRIGPSSVGDNFAFIPPYGFDYLNLSEGGNLDINVNKKGNIKIVGANAKNRTVKFVITDII